MKLLDPMAQVELWLWAFVLCAAVGAVALVVAAVGAAWSLAGWLL